MKDNNTNQSDNRIELGDVTIYEPALGNNEGVMIKLKVPFRFYLSGRRSLSEYKRISMEDVRTKASTIFELIKHLNYSIIEGESNDLAKHAEFIDVLSTFGEGLLEAQEATENEFDWYVKKQTSSPGEIKPLDLSNSSIEDLARKLSDIMHNPNLPVKIHHCLADELNQIFVDTNSEENILLNLKEMLKNDQTA